MPYPVTKPQNYYSFEPFDLFYLIENGKISNKIGMVLGEYSDENYYLVLNDGQNDITLFPKILMVPYKHINLNLLYE